MNERTITMFLTHPPRPDLPEGHGKRETAQFAAYDRSAMLMPKEVFMAMGDPNEVEVTMKVKT
jgi:hypothetical protein